MRRFIAILLSVLVLGLTQVSMASAAGTSWTVRLRSITGSAALGDNKLAVAAGDSVYLLSEGEVLWTWKADGEVGNLAADKKGAIYISVGSTLFKLDINGANEWKANTMDKCYAIKALDSGIILVGYEYGMLAFGENGNKIWEFYAHEECDI